MAGSQDPSVVDPGNSTYSLRSPDSVPAADIPSTSMDRVLPRQTSTGLARGIQQFGSPNVYADSGNEQLIVAKSVDANTNNPQVLMGNQVNKGEGFYVTKPGIDVTTASNDSDFIFNSNQNVFKIVASATSSITAPSVTGATVGVFTGGNTIAIPHGLSITPAFLAYATLNDFEYYPVGSAIATASDLHGNYGYSSFGFTVDATNVYIAIRTTLWIMNAFSLTIPGGTVPVKYYLMQETVN